MKIFMKQTKYLLNWSNSDGKADQKISNLANFEHFFYIRVLINFNSSIYHPSATCTELTIAAIQPTASAAAAKTQKLCKKIDKFAA